MPLSYLVTPRLVNLVVRVAVFILGVFMSIGVAVQLVVAAIRGKGVMQAPREKGYPPQLQLPVWGEHKHVVANGIKMHYVERTPAHDDNGVKSRAENGKAPLMLCLHGFPENWYSWRNILFAFSSKYRVVAPDLRGYGETQRGESSGLPWPLNCGRKARGSSVDDYSIERLVEDVRALILELGETQCVLVSHDWGSMVAWAFAYAYPSMVSNMIVMNGPHPLAMEDSMTLKQFLASSYIALFQVPFIPEMLLRSSDYAFLRNAFFGKKMGIKRSHEESPLAMRESDLEVFRYYMSRAGALTAALNWYRNIFAESNKEFLARIGFARHPAPPYHTFLAPTLVLWGEDDGALLPPQAKAVCKYVAGDRADVVYVKNCSHWIQNDAVEDVIVAMAEFLGMALPPAYGHPSIGNLSHGKASVSSSSSRLLPSAAASASGGQKIAVNDFRRLRPIVERFQEAYEELKKKKRETSASGEQKNHQQQQQQQHHLATPWGSHTGSTGFVDKGLSSVISLHPSSAPLPTASASPIGLSPPRFAPASAGGIALKSPSGPASTSASRRTSLTADDIATFSAAMTGAGVGGGGGGAGGAGRNAANEDGASSSSTGSGASVASGSQGGGMGLGPSTPSHIIRKRGGNRS